LTNAVAASSPPSKFRNNKAVLEPRSGWQAIHFGELWQYRELLFILAGRDIKVRYKQTVLGAAWALIQPLLNTIVFVAIFSGLAPGGCNPKIFFFAGNLIWILFSSAVSSAGNSLIGNQNLIAKVYFPRLVIPIASVIVSLADFCVGFGLLIVMMLIFRVEWPETMLLIPVFVAMAFLAALSVGLWLAALNVEFRDIRYVIPFLVQFGIFITPVIYPANRFDKTPWKLYLLGLNPMSGVVEGFRWCILGTEVHWYLVVMSGITTLILLTGGLFYFRRMEKTFADLV
jgi:lipopolysaccharide transport system permease protein